MARSREESDPGQNPDAHADPESVAREIVLRQLTGQARSRQELAAALAKKDVPDAAAQAVLDRMEDVGLVDDARFAEGWVASRQQRRHLSRRALRHELQRKGVDREVIGQALETVEDEDEHAAALDLAVRKARSMTGLEPHVRRRRLAGALARKGFGGAVVTRVLGELDTPVPDDGPWPDEAGP